MNIWQAPEQAIARQAGRLKHNAAALKHVVKII